MSIKAHKTKIVLVDIVLVIADVLYTRYGTSGKCKSRGPSVLCLILALSETDDFILKME
jgi:hypothetical protein